LIQYFIKDYKKSFNYKGQSVDAVWGDKDYVLFSEVFSC